MRSPSVSKPDWPLVCEKGEDSFEDGACYSTFGIHVKSSRCGDSFGVHLNMIQVYGNEQLRDRIVQLLNAHGMGN